MNAQQSKQSKQRNHAGLSLRNIQNYPYNIEAKRTPETRTPKSYLHRKHRISPYKTPPAPLPPTNQKLIKKKNFLFHVGLYDIFFVFTALTNVHQRLFSKKNLYINIF